MSESSNLNGYQNMGMAINYFYALGADTKLLAVFIGIAKYSVGYCRATTNVPLSTGRLNSTSGQWAKSINVSLSKFKRDLAELVKLGILRVHQGSNYRAGGGSYANYYSIIFNPTLQKAKGIYFNLTGVASKSTNPANYFLNEAGEPELLYTPGTTTTTKAWKAHVAAGGVLTNPTQEQL